MLGYELCWQRHRQDACSPVLTCDGDLEWPLGQGQGGQLAVITSSAIPALSDGN